MPLKVKNKVALASANLRPAPQLKWEEVDSEIIIFEQASTTYHVLNEAASIIWKNICSGVSNQELLENLKAFFAGDEQLISIDVEAFCNDMIEKGLLIKVIT